MVTGFTMTGSADVGEIVICPPLKLNWMVSWPALVFAAWIAARSVQGLAPPVHMPLAKGASPESLTTKVAAQEVLDSNTPARAMARGRSGAVGKDGLCGMVLFEVLVYCRQFWPLQASAEVSDFVAVCCSAEACFSDFALVEAYLEIFAGFAVSDLHYLKKHLGFVGHGFCLCH